MSVARRISSLSRREFLRTTAGTVLTAAAASVAGPMASPGRSLWAASATDAEAMGSADLGQIVKAAMERYQVPGVAVGIIHEGQDFAATFGVTSVENPLPITNDTLFQIGSTTKTFTASMIMRLVEDGKLKLDVPVRTYLPDLKLADESVARQVTLLHLLTHTGGWYGDDLAETGPGDDAVAKAVDRLASYPQLTPIGLAFSYNNTGLTLAGRVIEVTTGQSWDAALKELILDPLGMEQSFTLATEAISRRVVVGHANLTGKPEVLRPWAIPRGANPAGAIISSVNDQLRYAWFHLGDGTSLGGARVLASESLARMQSPQGPGGTLGFDELEAFGLTWMLRHLDGNLVLQHGGSTIGQQSAFLLVPERGFAVTVLTNANEGTLLNHEVTTWALQHYLGLAEPVEVPLQLSDAQLAPYTGRYDLMPGSPIALELTVSNGYLLAGAVGIEAEPLRLAFYAEDRVMVPDPPVAGLRMDFIRQPDGTIGWLRYSGRALPRQGLAAKTHVALGRSSLPLPPRYLAW